MHSHTCIQCGCIFLCQWRCCGEPGHELKSLFCQPCKADYIVKYGGAFTRIEVHSPPGKAAVLASRVKAFFNRFKEYFDGSS